MGEGHVDRSVNILKDPAGRREAVRALSTGGMALLAALGWRGDAASKPHTGNRQETSEERGKLRAEKKKKVKTKTGPPGPAGADGTAGAPGATGPAGASGADFAITVVVGDASEGLLAETGSTASSAASCGGEGKP